MCIHKYLGFPVRGEPSAPSAPRVAISARHAARNGHAARGGDGSASLSSVWKFPTHPGAPPANGDPLMDYFRLFSDCRETLPRLDNYRISMRNLKRPSIGELQGEAADQVSSYLKWRKWGELP